MRANLLKAAKLMRQKVPIGSYDSLVSFKNGSFTETHMGYDSYCGHIFVSRKLSYKEVLRLIRKGWN